jgi:hypothetical protein
MPAKYQSIHPTAAITAAPSTNRMTRSSVKAVDASPTGREERRHAGAPESEEALFGTVSSPVAGITSRSPVDASSDEDDE